jgi:DUF1680 family protein
MSAQQQPQHFQPMPFGAIKPTGWLKEHMQNDLNGFVGNLDKLVPALINDPIYFTGRLTNSSKTKDLGNLKAGDMAGDEQYKWWNSETQSNWWDGYIRHVFLLNDAKGIEKVKQYVAGILATQDADGYIGIYDKELRYHFSTENGELWSKATLYRGLLAYYEATKDEKVWKALVRAVDNVMQNYPINNSSPFNSGTNFNGGVSHGLTFTDVLDRMYFHTNEAKYYDYAVFLYTDFSATYQSEEDVQLKNILNPDYKLKSHGVHTFEHIRPLIVAAYASAQPELKKVLAIYLKRIKAVTSISGGAIGDEWIAGRTADATHTGYEYCSLQELLDSYALCYQKSGLNFYGDAIEQLFYNAAQGAHHPEHSSIAYLKTDNSFEMMGTKNGEEEHDRKQTRYKYSPAHQDIAVCCNPNAGRITPYFIQNSWMRENDTTLVATLLMPNVLETEIAGTTLRIENTSHYPYENKLNYTLHLSKPQRLKFKFRNPTWAEAVISNEAFVIENGFIVVEREFAPNDAIQLSFETHISVKKDNQQKHYFTYGALMYAMPIAAKEIKGRVYLDGLNDLMYEPTSSIRYSFLTTAEHQIVGGKLQTQLLNQRSKKPENVELIPLGKTILRQVTF